MDVETAKTLVSVILVMSIALFSYVSLEMLFKQVTKDLQAARAQRSEAAQRVEQA